MPRPWQVLFSPSVPVTAMIMLDHEYAANWSLATHPKIFTPTIGHVLGRDGT